MASHLVTAKTIRLVVVSAALVGFASLGVQGSNRERRAHLSADLTRHQARRTTARERVIVHGTARDLDLLASRHRLHVVKRMRGAAVVLANSAELSDLSRDGAVDHLSGDLRVRSSTLISDASTAADQTRAGNALLVGLLGIPGVDGQGIGVAILDSGIAPHSALGQRVVANVSFVTGDPRDDRCVRSRHARRRDRRRQPRAGRRRRAGVCRRHRAPRASSSTSGCSALTAAASRATSSTASNGSSPTARATTSASSICRSAIP